MAQGALMQDELQVERYRALLFEVSQAIATNRDLTALFRDLARRLVKVVSFDYIALFLYDEQKDVMRVHLLGTADTDSVPPGTEMSVDESFSGLAFKTQQPVLVPNARHDMRFPATAHLRPSTVESFCILPLTTIVRRLGAIGFGSTQPHTFDDAEVDFLQQVATQIAVGVDNV